SMSGLPGGGARWLAPDGGIEILVAVEIAADPVEQVSLARELVEGSLVLRGGKPMAGNPGIGGPLLEDAGETRPGGGGIAIHKHRVVTVCSELVEGGLIIRRSQAVMRLPGGRGGGLHPQRRVERCRAAVSADVH